MSGFWDDVFGVNGGSGACNTLQQNSYGYTPMHVDIKHSGEIAPLSPPSSHGAEPQNTDDSSPINHLAENLPGGDDYARLERAAIVWESEQPPFDDPTGCAGVPGFDDCIPITDAERFALNLRLMNPAQESTETAKSVDTTQPASVQHSASMALPACCTCASFSAIPDSPSGRCHAEGNRPFWNGKRVAPLMVYAAARLDCTEFSLKEIEL